MRWGSWEGRARPSQARLPIQFPGEARGRAGREYVTRKGLTEAIFSFIAEKNA
jgi:hypothetical protein